MPVDIAILKFFNLTIANSAFDFFFKFIDDFSIWRWPALVVIILLLWKGGAKGRWLVALAILTALIIDPAVHLVIKPLIGRLRPCQEAALGWLRLVDGCGGRYGFPSSHAANFFGQAVVIGAFFRPTRYYLYPIAVLVSLGRVYLGVHYPTDILGGAVFGAAVGILVVAVSKRIAPDRIGKYYRPQGSGASLNVKE